MFKQMVRLVSLAVILVSSFLGSCAPMDADAYTNRGLAYHEDGDLDQAIADYDQALVLDPQHVGAYYSRGNAYFSKGDFDQAITDFDQAIELDQQYVNAYYNRGLA